MAARLGESTQLLNIPFEPVYKALSIGVGLYALVLFVEAGKKRARRLILSTVH